MHPSGTWKRIGLGLIGLATTFPAFETLASPEVYLAVRAEFATAAYTARGYEVKARMFYAFPLAQVLDATHDHRHMSELDPDIQREDVMQARCTKDACQIVVQVLVGSFFPVGEIQYELETRVEEKEDGVVVIEWEKAAGTRFVKHLYGRLTLKPSSDGAGTDVNYHIQVAAPRLSADKLAAKAESYLVRLSSVLQERHEGHDSLWSRLHEEQE